MNGTKKLLQYQPATAPLERVKRPPAPPVTPDTVCAWCGIKTAAIPDKPVLVENQYFHPTKLCLHAAWRRRVIRHHHSMVRATR